MLSQRLPSLQFITSLTLACLLTAPCWATENEKRIPWHPSIQEAKAAAAISGRPVLVVFGASWSDASVELYEKTLHNSEAIAIVTACFEPVQIDVDVDPLTTKNMGVTYLPSACVIDQDSRVLSSFDCPESPASFIAAAGKAVQDAAAARQETVAMTPVQSSQAPSSPTQAQSLSAGIISSSLPQAQQASTTATIPVSSFSAPSSSPVTTQSPVADNRPLSRFSTTSQNPPLPSPASTAQPVAPNTIGYTPRNAWPAEPATTMPSAMPPSPSLKTQDPIQTPQQTTTAARPTIEPRTSQSPPSPSGMASWLGDSVSATAPATTPPTSPPSRVAQEPTSQSPPATTYGMLPPPAPAQTIETQEEEEEEKKPNAFLAAMQRPFRFFSSAPKIERAEPTIPADIPTVGTADPYGTMPLGMEGYCPVTLAEKSVWVEGRAQWGVRHRGRTYLFAGEPQQRVFLADPDRYAPALSGDDPVLAFDNGKSVPGQRRYGVTYQSRTYLFSSPETRTLFSSNPQRYTTKVTLAENPASKSDTLLR